MFADVQFLRRITGQRIGARQVGQREVVAVEAGLGLGRIDGYTAVIAYTGMSTRGIVEERRLATVGIAHQGHVQVAASLQGLT